MTIEVTDPSSIEPTPSRLFRPLGIFNEWRLQVYGYAVAAIYAAFLVCAYRSGVWIVNNTGLPVYTDFACAWAATLEALRGTAASLYDPSEFVKVQAALVGSRDYFYPNWPYPPTFFLILAPFTVLPYNWGFIVWDLATLLSLVIIVYLILPRLPAIALVLASPFTAWNFLAAQNGFLTGSLLGAGLLFLESRPVLAGVFIGSLTYKPQFGILIPLALAASRQWRAFASAVVTAALLVAVSIAVFGTDVWAAFPRQLVAQSSVNFFGDPDGDWGYLQTVYGLIRNLHGSARLAWLAQGLTALMSAVIVWIAWRSQTRYALKAATLSAAALIATPYAFAYDIAAIVVPAAFLATDQRRRGLLPGEQTIWIILFGAPLIVLITLGDNVGGPTFGGTPISLLTVIALFCVILRRARHPTAAA